MNNGSSYWTISMCHSLAEARATDGRRYRNNGSAVAIFICTERETGGSQLNSSLASGAAAEQKQNGGRRKRASQPSQVDIQSSSVHQLWRLFQLCYVLIKNVAKWRRHTLPPRAGTIRAQGIRRLQSKTWQPIRRLLVVDTTWQSQVC